MSENEKNKKEAELVILVDMDGVLTDFVGGWKKAWNRTYSDRLVGDDEDCTSFFLEESFKDKGTVEEITQIFEEPGFFYDLEPMRGALEAFIQMSSIGIDLFICTAPSLTKTCWQEKADWVEHHLGKEWLNRLIITKDKTLIGADYLIDDKPKIQGIYDPSWRHVIFDQPYNQHVTDKPRVNWTTWPSILLYNGR